jgi:hypothetical protein
MHEALLTVWWQNNRRAALWKKTALLYDVTSCVNVPAASILRDDEFTILESLWSNLETTPFMDTVLQTIHAQNSVASVVDTELHDTPRQRLFNPLKTKPICFI